MVNGISHTHKLVKQNRQCPVFTNGPLDKTSKNSNSHDNSNENVDVRIKEPITTVTYSIPINNEYGALFLFWCILFIFWQRTTSFSILCPHITVWILLRETCMMQHNTVTTAPSPIVILS